MLVPSPAGKFAYGKVDPSEAGKQGQAELHRNALARKLALTLEEGDVFEQLAEGRPLWQLCVDVAAKQADEGDPSLLFKILQYATDRARGRAAQTHYVAIDQRPTIRPSEIEWARQVARELRGELTAATERDIPVALPPSHPNL